MAHVVFFDGVCNLCNRSVDFIIKRDTKRNFKYASLQSEYAAKALRNKGLDTDSLYTIVLLKNEKVYTRSRAVLEIVRGLRFPWPVFYIFTLVPGFIRDALYNYVSTHRYAWFGRREICRVPSEEEKLLFMEDERRVPGRESQVSDFTG